MTKFKCLPNYQLIRNGKTIAFDLDGLYETSVQSEIELLGGCKPFISKVSEVKPKSPPKKSVETKPKKK